MSLDHPTFARILTRCHELATTAGADPAVRRVYEERLQPLATKYLAAHAALPAAETAASTERTEAAAALQAIDKPYRTARAIARAYVPTLTVPETLKVLTTDTDQAGAIQALLDILDARGDSEAWAREQLEGEFGRLAPIAVREMNEHTAASTTLSKARDARATEYGPTWERYIPFKNVVRHTYGPSSPEYRRIHVGRGAERDPTPIG